MRDWWVERINKKNVGWKMKNERRRRERGTRQGQEVRQPQARHREAVKVRYTEVRKVISPKANGR